MRFLYNLAAILIVTIIIPIFMLRATRERGFVERIKQSFGFYPQETIDKVAGKNAIWVHAASVGEIVATSPLVREFRKAFPDSPILVSVVTTGGYEMAHRIIKDADAIIYFPLDLPFLASRVVGRIRPRVFLPVETELWPNFLKKAKQLDVPVMMVNGRISDRSVKQYKYLFGMLREMIGTVKCFAMQSSIDADYIMRLGAPRELVTVTGNTKFDQAYTSVSPEERAALIKELGLEGASRIMIAGSTLPLPPCVQKIRTCGSSSRRVRCCARWRWSISAARRALPSIRERTCRRVLRAARISSSSIRSASSGAFMGSEMSSTSAAA